MCLSPRILLTDGVERLQDGYLHPKIGVYVSKNNPRLLEELLDAGLASELKAPWWRPKKKAALLSPGLVNGIFHSILHNATGMLRAVIICFILGVIAKLFNNPGMMGVSLFGTLFLISILLHEIGHVFAFRYIKNNQQALLVSAGVHCHLVRPKLQRCHEIFVVTAGPAAPMIPLIIISPFAADLPFLTWVWGWNFYRARSIFAYTYRRWC